MRLLRSLLRLTICIFTCCFIFFLRADTITFEDLPDAYFFSSGDQNIGDYYPGITFGPDVTALSVTEFGGYDNTGFPPHSGDVVIWDVSDPTITISFDSPISSFGIWYTTYDPLTLDVFDSAGDLLDSVIGNPNTDGTTGTSSLLSLSDSGIESVTLTSTPGFFVLDDLTYQTGTSAVPEPSTLGFLVPALLLLIFFRTRRRIRRIFAWGIFAVLTWLAPLSLLAQTDTTPPVLTAMSLNPSSVNVTGGPQTVTILLTLTDDLSGVNFDAVPFLYNEFTLQSPSGKQTINLTDNIQSFSLVSGTPLNGVWQGTLTIPKYSESGLWTVTSLVVFDNAENQLALDTGQLAALGFPTTINVASNPSLTPPTVLSLSFSPASINTTASSQSVTLTLTLADSPAGVIFPAGNQLDFDFQIMSPSGNQSQWLSTDEFTLTSGTPQNGTWAGTFTMPRYSEPGVWTIQQLLLQDAANNSENLDAVALQALGFSPLLIVSDSTPDTTPPRLTNFTFSPQVLDTSIGQQTVVATLHATDNLSGVSFAPTTEAFTFFYGPFLENPSGTKTLFPECFEVGGTPLNGTWQCNLSVPSFSEAGAWTVSDIELKDADDNEVDYSTSQLQSLGFPTVLTIKPVTQGAAFYGSAGTTTNPTGFFAEPINSATGDYFSSQVDLAMQSRGNPLQFVRYYNSLDPYSGPLGNGWSHTYNTILTQDPQNGQVTITQPDGSAVLFTSVGSGQYAPATAGLFDTLVQNADGSFTFTRKDQKRLTFSSVGELLAIIDRNGNTQSLTYTSSGNLTAVSDSSGRGFTFTYDGLNRIVTVSDSISRTVQYSYDVNDNLVSIRDTAGGVTQYTYDASHRMLSAVDPRGVTFLQNTYDSLGRVVAQANGRGFVSTLAYDSPSVGTTTFTDPLGNITQHVYDSTLQLIRVVNAKGGAISYTYDSNNDRTSITNQNGSTTNLTYDSSGNTTGITDPLGNVQAFTYDLKNDLLTATNPKGATTTFGYDANGNLLSIKDALGDTTAFAYSSSGLLTSKTDARGNATSYTYDAAGDLTRVTDSLGDVTTLTYDGVGRMLTATDPNGHASSVAYDALDRILKTTDALNHATQFSYDAIGNLLKITDANGNAVSYAYDATNDLISVTDALSGVTAYGYDANDNRTSFTNAKSNTTSYAFDALNRLTKIIDPLSFTTSYAYDAVGNTVSTTDANGKTNQYTYDALNRLSKGSYADGSSVSFTYDKDGNRATMVDSRGTTTYSYDALDRVLSVTSPNTATVQYAYDPVGNRSTLGYPDGRTVQYQYDALNRLSQVTDWASKMTHYAYDPASNLTGFSYPNGASSLYFFDAANRLLEIVNRSSSNVLSSFTYLLDSVGNRLQVTSAAGGTTTYAYDPLYRLTSWAAPSGQPTQYAYDPVGNRLSMVSSAGTTSYAYDADDRMLSAGTTSYGYDNNGNQVSKTTGGSTVSYFYDALNRLIGASGAGINSQYQYDGDGNRVTQTVPAGTYQYFNDTATALPVVLNEAGPDGNIDYLYGQSMISETSSAFQYFYQSDGVGSAASLTDATGMLKASYSYDPWGKLLVPIDPLGTKNKYKFTGEALDPGTALYFLHARNYDVTTARFTERDLLPPSVYVPKFQNAYSYVANDPLRLVDPTGLSAVDAEMSGQSAPSASSSVAPPQILQPGQYIQKFTCFYFCETTQLGENAAGVPYETLTLQVGISLGHGVYNGYSVGPSKSSDVLIGSVGIPGVSAYLDTSGNRGVRTPFTEVSTSGAGPGFGFSGGLLPISVGESTTKIITSEQLDALLKKWGYGQ